MSPDRRATKPVIPPYEDEISLVDIIRVLLRRKILILEIMVISVCLGLAYAFTQPRVYQVETIISPPSVESIQSFNLRNLQEISGDTLFSNFTALVITRTFRQEFFNKFKLIDTLSDVPVKELTTRDANKIFEDFSADLKSSKKKNNIFTLEGIHKEKIGVWLDDFIVMANEKVVNQLVNNIESGRKFKIKTLQKDINDKRLFYNQIRNDELKRLQEDYQTAKSLGIVERNSSRNTVLSKSNLSIYMQGTKRYMEGTKILQAEINAIKNRRSDDIHIAGLRAAQEQLAKLEAITIDKGNLQSVMVDKNATVNVEVIGPKRTLIVILSLILGGVLGVFAVLIMEFIGKTNKTKS